MKARVVATEDQMMASVPGRYASALFELAKEQSQLQLVENDLNSILAMLDESSDLMRMVRSPVFSADDQLKALAALLGQAGIGGLTLNFVKLIAHNRRLFALPDMIKAFRTLAASARGEVEADVEEDEEKGSLDSALTETTPPVGGDRTYVNRETEVGSPDSGNHGNIPEAAALPRTPSACRLPHASAIPQPLCAYAC